MDNHLSYCISYDNRTILEPSNIDLILGNNQSLNVNNSIKSNSVRQIKEQIISPVPEKRKIIPDIYSLLSISFRQPYKLEFRVYDDGVAYRILTFFRDSIRVKNEISEFSFPGKPFVYFPQVKKREDADIFHTSFEEERMLAGGFDYEPGLLNNATASGTRPVSGTVTSPGTRCHQLSMFIIYDSPMQIFSGNPSEGMREPDFMEITGHLPTTWDETIIPDAKAGEYIVTVRQKGDNWFVAGMTNWSARDLTVKFDFLPEGNYEATVCRDGVNADRYAADYVIQKRVVVKKNDEMRIHLAPGGGFLIRLDKR